jgi:hypothetical protein
METRLHPVGDDPRTIAVGRRWRRSGDAQGKQQAAAVGAAEVEILPNDGFEEVAALHRPVEDLRETEFELIEGQPMVVPRGPVRRRERPGKALRPAIEEGLDIARAQRITRGLQGGGVGTRQKPIIETLETNPLAPELLLDPLMAVETDLYRVRDVGADLDECRPPLAIVEVEIVLRGRDPLAREVKGHATLRAPTLLRFERPLLFLGETEQHHALALGEARAMGIGDRIFVLAGLEFHHGNGLRRGKLLDRRGESVVHRLEERGGRNRVAEVIAQEVAKTAGGLQLRQIGMQIEAVDAADLQRDVVTDNVSDVGFHRNLLAEIPAMVLLTKHAGLRTGPNIFSEAAPQTAHPHVFRPVTCRFEAQLH